MGASTGNFGTARAQLALRQTFQFIESYVLLKPEVMVFKAAERFDDDGELTDEATREQVVAQLRALVDWARLLKSRPQPGRQ
jgi:chromate reductase